MKINIIGQKPIILDRSHIYEHMDEIIDLAGKYFTSFHSHDVLGGHKNGPYIMENALYTFSKGSLNLDVTSKINLQYDGSIPEVFFEDKNTYGSTVLPSRSAIRIVVNGRFAGHYLTDINSLLLTDWTHDTDCVKVFRKVWSQLVENLSLKPVDLSLRTRTISKFTVGCDPEFELVEKLTGDIVRADSILGYNCSEPIGTDGAGWQIEFRPAPGNAMIVTHNIRKLIKQFDNSMRLRNKYDLTDEGNHYPLGGHIHVGVGFEMKPDLSLVTLLDDFIGKPTIVLSGKARNNFLRLGAYRVQPHGFEYRTTPSAVFQNPAIAYIALRLVGNLTEKYLTGEVFEYDNENIRIEDYITYGGLTKNQAKYFMKFCSNYKPKKSLASSWKVNNSLNQMNSLTIKFRDTWTPYIKRLIIRGISSNCKKNQPITIVFYGLSEKTYGKNRATINVPGCSIAIGRMPTWDPAKRILSIGLSYDIRNCLMTYSGSLFMQSMLETVYHEIDKLEV